MRLDLNWRRSGCGCCRLEKSTCVCCTRKCLSAGIGHESGVGTPEKVRPLLHGGEPVGEKLLLRASDEIPKLL
jgi:hypothetical protein